MRAATLLLLLMLTACAAPGGGDYSAYLAKKRVKDVTVDSFSHCRGYGCKIVETNIKLSDKDWKQIRKLFKPPPKSAEDERQRIVRAIGLFEEKVGALTGTAEDVEGTYHKLGRFQHDCVDESVNTTIYLSLLDQQGLLRFHSVSTPTARVPPLSLRLGPHQTAVVQEKDTGTRHAIDSWFHDNGHPAETVPIDQWFFGWRPAKSE